MEWWFIKNIKIDKDGKINEKEINIKENDIDFNCLPKAIKEKEEKAKGEIA